VIKERKLSELKEVLKSLKIKEKVKREKWKIGKEWKKNLISLEFNPWFCIL
jgi:hypothetical protein